MLSSIKLIDIKAICHNIKKRTLFEDKLQFPVASQANVATLQDGSGTIAWLSDITGGGIALTDLSAISPIYIIIQLVYFHTIQRLAINIYQQEAQ